MKNNISFLLIFVLISFISCEGDKPNTYKKPPTQSELTKQEINKKFYKSSKSTLINVRLINNITAEIKIQEGEYGFKTAIIDVVVALARLKSATGYGYANVKIIGTKKTFSYDINLFNKYRTGQINDSQFLRKGKLRKRRK